MVPAADLDLGYRRSSIGAAPGRRVGRARAGARATRPTPRREIAEIVRWRRANQPGGQNAGSVFTNPPGDSAGRLIDAAGAARACASARAEVSTKHANFIQADDGGSADDVLALMQRSRARVRDAHGVDLQPETAAGRVRRPRPRSRSSDRRRPRPARSTRGSGPRRIEVRREEGRRRLRRLLIALGVLAVLALAVGADLQPARSTSTTSWSTAPRTRPRQTSVPRPRSARRQPMAYLDTSAAAHRVEALPWVAPRRCAATWPGTVRIDVVERVPVAATPVDGGGWRMRRRDGPCARRRARAASGLSSR